MRRKIIRIDEELCDGCGACIPACEEGALRIVDGKARLVSEALCDGLGACIGECPRGAIELVEVEIKEERPSHSLQGIPCCPIFAVKDGDLNWPVKIFLVSPLAPFLEGAHLLVAADCAPVVCKEFHGRFVKDRVVLIGCPKFGDYEGQLEKLRTIFSLHPPKGVTILRMDVPCCGGLPLAVKEALRKAGRDSPVEVIVLSHQGEIKGVQTL